MSDPVKARSVFRAPARVAAVSKTLPCSTCRARVDPLRAARVAIFAERFRYFCSPKCRERYVPSAPLPEPAKSLVGLGYGAETVARLTPREEATADAPARELRQAASIARTPPNRWLDGAVWLGLLGAATAEPLRAAAPHWLAPLLGATACAALAKGSADKRRDAPSHGHRAASLVAPVAATLAALGSLLLEPIATRASSSVAGMVCAIAAGSLVLCGRKQQAYQGERASIERALLPENKARTAHGGAASSCELKPGEELLLQAGDRVAVDAVISAGHATVEPWLGSPWRVLRKEGDAMLAGSKVVDGALRAVVRWVGNDRAWARLSVDPSRRADRHTALAKLAEQIATVGAGALGLSGLVIALSLDVSPVLALGYAAAACASLANIALSEVVALYVSKNVYRLLARGISFRNAGALDRAGRTSTVVFCDQGTLMRGEFSVASIEPSGHMSTQELSSLLAGAYAGVPSPLGAALQRSALAQKLRPDATRSPNYMPGLGVTAVASNGQSLVVGTRALLLERRISVASAEAHVAELEALGRSVLLVALDGRWVGLVALQDSLEPGARAAVQHLLDAGVEPVLLSGDSRETCRALARHMGIEHVRPEVMPEDRAAEIRRLSQTVAMLAVVGRSTTDDAALAAASLSINVDATGGLERWDVDVASGDVRDAAIAIQLARELTREARGALLTALAPVAGALFLLLLGLPPWVVPLAGFGGALVALWRLGAPVPASASANAVDAASDEP